MTIVGLSRNLTCAPDVHSAPKVLFKSQVGGTKGVKVEPFPVTFDGYTYQGHLAYSTEEDLPRPVVLVFPNYAGEKQFDVDVAIFLAKLGYAGLSVDLYKSTEVYPREMRDPGPDADPEQIGKHLHGAFGMMNGRYNNPREWRALCSAYLQEARKHKAVHPKYAGAIGYCFGGQCVLEMLRNGDDLQGIVSFHGLLHSKPMEEPFDFSSGIKYISLDEVKAAQNVYNRETKVLIENGVLDRLTTTQDYEAFKEEMKQQDIDFQFHDHGPDVDHGFALAPGLVHNRYDEDADRRSTMSMISLFAEVWPEFMPNLKRATVNACGTDLRIPAKL